MNAGAGSTVELWTESGGDGAPTLVLLHGLGANAAVWDGLKPLVLENWPGRWMTVDLRGHGRSPHASPYAYAVYAADVAAAVGEQDTEVATIGHSMGGVVGMALATGWFGLNVRRVLAFGVKIDWTDGEIAKMKHLGSAPAKWFDSREAAIDRYLKVSGLIGLVTPDTSEAALGVVEEGGRYRLASAPGINAAAGPAVADFYHAAQAPIRLAAGEGDPMVSLEDMMTLDPGAVLWEGVGHNVHVERPDLVWELFEKPEGEFRTHRLK